MGGWPAGSGRQRRWRQRHPPPWWLGPGHRPEASQGDRLRWRASGKERAYASQRGFSGPSGRSPGPRVQFPRGGAWGRAGGTWAGRAAQVAEARGAGLLPEWAGPGLAEQVWVGGACGMRRARSERMETGQSGRIRGEVTGLSYSWTEPREEDCALPVNSACTGGWSQRQGGASRAGSWGARPAVPGLAVCGDQSAGGEKKSLVGDLGRNQGRTSSW